MVLISLAFLDGTTPAPSEVIRTELPDKTMKSEDNPAYAAVVCIGPAAA
jgi:hypothetical protein